MTAERSGSRSALHRTARATSSTTESTEPLSGSFCSATRRSVGAATMVAPVRMSVSGRTSPRTTPRSGVRPVSPMATLDVGS
ncbi:hypothetical protein ACFVDQ_18070 [Streptomyces sp. NPDC057684]|uniref:hypothetical protein n=1 Tax=Streptomyces sp. NPDC057684 TaxID=3346211 RepID=UPI0036B09839